MIESPLTTVPNKDNTIPVHLNLAEIHTLIVAVENSGDKLVANMLKDMGNNDLSSALASGKLLNICSTILTKLQKSKKKFTQKDNTDLLNYLKSSQL